MAKNKPIVVVPYRPAWAQSFLLLSQQYSALLGDLILRVEHVGSTAVPGLWAKPKIDIDIVVSNFKDLDLIVAKLVSIGYEHRGDLGVPLREAFRYVGADDFPEHNMYVCKEGCDSLCNHLAVRHYLLTNPEAVVEYSELKSTLAKKYPYDIDAYIEGKTDFLVGILRESGFEESALQEITDINKKKL